MSATKHHAPDSGSPYRVPPEPQRWPAIGLALGVHALLLAFLWIGVSWQNNAPVAVEAEVWDVTTQTAAPPPPPPPQEVEPEPEPETAPPQPVEKAVEPPPVERPLPPKQPDIALEREKKRKEALKKRQEEERLEREQELAEEKAEQKRLEEKKAKLAEKKEAEKKAKELAKKEDAEKKKKAEKEKAEKLAKEKAEKAEAAKLAKMRDAEMSRMMAAAGTTGSAEKSTAPRSDPGYESAIRSKIKGNTSYAGDLDEPGNPTAVFRVEQLPTGEIISVKKIKSSGIPAFDDAVAKGIEKSSPLKKKKDGTVERSLVIEFHMKDLQ